MDLSEKDKFGLEKSSEDHLSYHNPCIPSDWRFGNPQMGLITPNTSISIPLCQGDQMGSSSSSCQAVSMVDSFSPHLWDHPTNSQNPGFCGVRTSTSLANNVPIRNPTPGPSRLDVGWNPSVSAGILPPSLSQFPADSAFIERAARFSCFNGGSFGGVMSSPYSNAPEGSQKNELGKREASNDVSMSAGNGYHVGVSGNESSELPKDSNSDNAVVEPSSKGINAKKRKRSTREMELDRSKGDATQMPVEKENFETKPSGKHDKDSADAPKEDYIHVRARRGQATNSHSLAERVRREKISERMKFLQDLVPGCSKVTGKAVMLDEIINYVQSLQRQVEFLSMKLAAVNPQLDLNIEELLSKEILQSQACSSSTIVFAPDMSHPQLHPAQQCFVQTGIPGSGNPSDALRRALNAQLTAMNAYKETTPHIPNSWDDEFCEVVHLGFNIPQLNGKTRDGFPI